MIATERLWLNADKSEVVKDGSPDAATLLCCVGGKVPDEFAPLVAKHTPKPKAADVETSTPAPARKSAAKK